MVRMTNCSMGSLKPVARIQWIAGWSRLGIDHTFDDSGRINSTHAEVGPSRFITFHGILDGQTTIEDQRQASVQRENVRHGDEGGVLAERVAGVGTAAGDQTAGSHVLEDGLFHQGEGRLRELRRKQQSKLRPEGIGVGLFCHRLEDRCLMPFPVIVRCLVLERHVVLSDLPAPQAAEIDDQLLGVILDDLGDFEACGCQRPDTIMRALTADAYRRSPGRNCRQSPRLSWPRDFSRRDPCPSPFAGCPGP